MKKVFRVFTVLVISAAIMLTFGLTAFAEPENDETLSEESVPSQSQGSEPSSQESEPSESAEPSDSTEPPEESSEESSEPSSSEESSATEETSQEPTEESSHDIDVLPEISENEFTVPTTIVEDVTPQSATVAAGVISWLCVAIGVIVIAAVLSSSRTENYMNGRQRYESGDVISGDKRRR